MLKNASILRLFCEILPGSEQLRANYRGEPVMRSQLKQKLTNVSTLGIICWYWIRNFLMTVQRSKRNRTKMYIK